MRLGYACINNTLAEQEIKVNRTMVKATFLAKGIEYASAIALKNVADLSRIIDWNIKHGMTFYRLSSDMFPWMSEYEFKDLPQIESIRKILTRVGEKVLEQQHRLTFHPGPFNVLASNTPAVVLKTIKDLRQHAEIMDMIGLPESPFAKINIHIGGSFGNKDAALERFIANAAELPKNVLSRLTIENDDKANMYSVKDLIKVHERMGTPIVFDYLHHQFCTGGLTEEEAFRLSVSTWPAEITPVVHYSSAKQRFEDKNAADIAHADYIYQHINRYGVDVDIMLEAKAKEQALIRYTSQYLKHRKTAAQNTL